ncbi:DUF3427 domain-containing protein [Ideonella sp. DXS22W]|uniref:DUF3427 domain-containing protein n=1 Tax=Pseudaquabacterium inlustre TaxID=2984192 RepID=A0ABU9CQV7_9BURK
MASRADLPRSWPDGLYELLVTERLAATLPAGITRTEALVDDLPQTLAEALARQLTLILEEVGGEGEERRERQLTLVNGLLAELRRRASALQRGQDLADIVDMIAAPPRQLTAWRGDRQFPAPPSLGLAAPWLFTAGKGTPSLLQELRHELASADRVDILVSFIRKEGVRKLADVLQQITALNAEGQPRVRLRVLTTTYTGATQAEALDMLAGLPGCELKVSLDGRRTRLHAKAWVFHRNSGFGSAYVGSANLSGAALTGGLEWTVKLTQRAQAALFQRAEATFETLWHDAEFQRYLPGVPTHRAALDEALRRARQAFGSGSASDDARPDASLITGFFDIVPAPHQQDMLEQLATERAHGRHRNLLVAATGTGKTVVAALDYRRTCQQQGGRPRLLFVAHREEILRQALRTYREVLRDGTFGEMLAGGRQPAQHDHLFATIDSLASRGVVASVGSGYWHSVVIDECHRIAAHRFTDLASAIQPALLLGLTATPERGDGLPITQFFDMRPDGRPAVELRLWRALDLQLLAPFEYYACDDDTDFSAVPWGRGASEQHAIAQVVDANQLRARLVLREWQRLASDARQCRALVFCVSMAHARFMAEQFNRAGLPAACITSETPDDERRRAPQRLASGELCALVTVDLYNEGVDLPFVDTLLLLRPTQSPVVFQQQVGRGLRLDAGKAACLVLDFVGQHRSDFRFDRLLSGLTGQSRRELLANVEQGFGHLPPGCHIHLQRQTRDQVLRSLRTLTQQSWSRLRAELLASSALRGGRTPALAEFMHDQLVSLDEIYRDAGRSSWTLLRRDAGLLASEPGPEEAYFGRRMAALRHVDDPLRLGLMARIGASAAAPVRETQAVQLLQMLAYQVDGLHGQVGDAAAFLARLAAHRPVTEELGELADVLQARSTVLHQPVSGLEDTPLCLHAAYQVREVLTAVGWLTATARAPFQAGVLALQQRKTELLFVTLDKREGYHDGIAYQDYAISPDLFHWQSQNTAGPQTVAGRRYLGSPGNGWRFQLFVRASRSMPYRACGPVTLVRSEGERPMSITWKLATALPVHLFQEFSVLRDV